MAPMRTDADPMGVASPTGPDVEGPVQAEVFVVWLRDGGIQLTGPCGSDPWMLELGATDHPLEVVDRIVRDVIGDPIVVHSTSWRRDRGAVILTFLVVIAAELVGAMATVRVTRVDLARSEATAAPREIAHSQVLEHALRHLAWLIRDDPAVREALPSEWRTALDDYVPEPFRTLG